MHAVGARGPDRYTELIGPGYHLCFHRLALHDLSPSGDQPFVYTNPEDDVSIRLMCNGEIYNYAQLISRYNLQPHLQGRSDCEVLVHLLVHFRYDLARVLEEVQGEYAIVVLLTDASGNEQVMAARDPFGVRPLYTCHTENAIAFSSLVTGLNGLLTGSPASSYATAVASAPSKKGKAPPPRVRGPPVVSVEHVHPGSVVIYTAGKTLLVSYYDVRTQIARPLPANTALPVIYRTICEAFVKAVQCRLNAERPLGFLLSGGLDSSLVVAVATRLCGYKNPQTFSIGMGESSEDLRAARCVAAHLGISAGHTEVRFTEKEGTDAVYDVVRVLETYDITTIRASVGQYLLARYIRDHTGVRAILNGDGSDEVACGYLYFHGAPSAEEAHEESQRLLREIHLFDGLRVDRTLGAHGLEARLPFLDVDFVRCYHSVPAALRTPGPGRMEKQLLRDAFHHCHPGLLPKEILYRTKEAFSDGVSNHDARPWYQVLQDWANELVSDAEFSQGAKRLRVRTKEAYLYRDIFDSFFPGQNALVPHGWMPRWSPGTTDPSARCLPVYEDLQKRSGIATTTTS